MPPVPRKRGDTWEPITGVAYENNGITPADLRGSTLRFLGKATVGVTTVYIDSGNAAHGECINVEDEVGSTVADRGKFRYEPLIPGVSQAGLFATELKANFAGKIITFPSAKNDNPQLQIDEDIQPI